MVRHLTWLIVAGQPSTRGVPTSRFAACGIPVVAVGWRAAPRWVMA